MTSGSSTTRNAGPILFALPTRTTNVTCSDPPPTNSTPRCNPVGYTFNCDGCETRFDTFPPFSGEFTERFIETTPSPLTAAFSPGEKVTLCRECAEAVFSPGKVIACYNCGWQQQLSKLTDRSAMELDSYGCPRCESNDLGTTGEAHDERE